MEIDRNKCVGCGNCHAVCTMGAIYLDEDGKSVVNQQECVECSTCYRVLSSEGYRPWLVRAIRKILSFFRLGYLGDVDVCPTGALTPPELTWPRNLRAQFSDPTVPHPGTGIMGRGTEEIKTNDVTGRLGPGEAGIVVEMGRPGTGAYFRDIEKITMALARLEPLFEKQNPLTQLLVDTRTGRIRQDILDEKVMSAIVEIKVRQEQIGAVLDALGRAAKEIETVFSVGVASRCLPDGTVAHEEWARRSGFQLSPNGKTNLGLGRPLFREEKR